MNVTLTAANNKLYFYRYRDRYWRESSFRGMELVRKTLEEVYGADQVSLASATFRWLNHHSAMKSKYSGKYRWSSSLGLREENCRGYGYNDKGEGVAPPHLIRSQIQYLS